jgi:hypothetical protein
MVSLPSVQARFCDNLLKWNNNADLNRESKPKVILK